MSDGLPLKQIIEGAIMAAESPLSVDQMMALFENDAPERADVRAALKEIEADCEERGFELKQVSSGYRFQVKQQYGEWVGRLWKEKPPRYSRALLETLALVAYKQPITRGDIEEIRGVAVSTNIMRTLLEREWVRVVGHRDVPGQPALYATTKEFLDYFNLRSLDELPSLAEIKDLTNVNEELDLEEELIEVRTLDLDETESEEIAGIDEADLDAVSEQVNTIQENIKNLFSPEPEPDDGLDDDLEEDTAETAATETTEQAEAAEPVENAEQAPAAEQEPSASEEPSANEEPSADEAPAADKEPSANEEPSVGEEPSIGEEPATEPTGATATPIRPEAAALGQASEEAAQDSQEASDDTQESEDKPH